MAGERILVIDDERIILELASMILTSKGYQVRTAGNGPDGLALLEVDPPELVLLDYMMPYMDGMTALREIRRRHPDTSVIMFTGKGSEEIAVELMKAGAADYLLKPFNNQSLVERIEGVLRLRRIEMHNRVLQQERERLLAEIADWNRELERRVEEKSQALSQAHAELVQGEKLAALGHLSAGMAHEIRNPLNSIGLFAQLLQSGLASDDLERSGYLDKIQEEVERIDGILVKLLAASKEPQVELRPVAITGVIDEVLGRFSPQFEVQGVTVVKEFVPIPPGLAGDVEEFEQIFSNLFSNALHAMPKGGRLEVRTHHAHGQIVIEVADSGEGISAENLKHIFDPFFTTKDKGTGFGLSVVLRMVKTYGGRISVTSELGRGTAFHLEFPLN